MPTLRELAWTAPYMHDGSLGTLDDVVRHLRDGRHRAPDAQPATCREPQAHRRRSAPTSSRSCETLSSETPPQPSREPWVNAAEPTEPRLPADTTVVSQVNKLFSPHYIRVRAGQPLTVLNDDTRTHNVRIYDPRFDYNSGAQEPHETRDDPLSRRAARSRPSAASTPRCG